jgi:hypothetical protein
VIVPETFKYLLLVGLSVFYFIYTIRYIKVLSSTTVFESSIRRFHFVMIWLIPFVWILILKNLIKPTPGSHEVDKNQDTAPFFDVYKSGE